MDTSLGKTVNWRDSILERLDAAAKDALTIKELAQRLAISILGDVPEDPNKAATTDTSTFTAAVEHKICGIKSELASAKQDLERLLGE